MAYPAVGSVRAGVVFGATNELTGTMTVPVAANVKNGVQYGAGGTEFTGIGFTSTGAEEPEPLLEL